MKRYLRKLTDSFVRRGTRRTINITEDGKYGTASARVHIRYDHAGRVDVYVTHPGRNWKHVVSLQDTAEQYNDRRAIDGQPGQIFPFTKETTPIKLSGSYGLSQDYDEHETNTEESQ